MSNSYILIPLKAIFINYGNTACSSYTTRYRHKNVELFYLKLFYTKKKRNLQNFKIKA